MNLPRKRGGGGENGRKRGGDLAWMPAYGCIAWTFFIEGRRMYDCHEKHEYGTTDYGLRTTDYGIVYG